MQSREYDRQDLKKTRWLSAVIISTITPAFTMILNQQPHFKLMNFTAGEWVLMVLLVILQVLVYTVFECTRERKDAFVSRKNVSSLLYTMVPAIVCFEVFKLKASFAKEAE
jgi:hypothetical protein